MMGVSVCLSCTRVSEVSLDQNAVSVDPVALGRGQERPSMRQQVAHDDAPTLQGGHAGERETRARSEAHQDGQIEGDIQWSRLLKPASMTSPLASWPLGRSESATRRLKLGGASWSSEPEPEP